MANMQTQLWFSQKNTSSQWRTLLKFWKYWKVDFDSAIQITNGRAEEVSKLRRFEGEALEVSYSVTPK